MWCDLLQYRFLKSLFLNRLKRNLSAGHCFEHKQSLYFPYDGKMEAVMEKLVGIQRGASV